jgi:hypothetical protein
MNKMREKEILECIANIIQTPEVVDMLKKHTSANPALSDQCVGCCLNGGGGNGVSKT